MKNIALFSGGIGDVEVFFNNVSETDDIMAIIQQAFRLQEVG